MILSINFFNTSLFFIIVILGFLILALLLLRLLLFGLGLVSIRVMLRCTSIRIWTFYDCIFARVARRFIFILRLLLLPNIPRISSIVLLGIWRRFVRVVIRIVLARVLFITIRFRVIVLISIALLPIISHIFLAAWQMVFWQRFIVVIIFWRRSIVYVCEILYF